MDDTSPEAGDERAGADDDRDSREPRVLEPGEVRFRREQGRLRMSDGHEAWRDVTLVRLFPLSEPERWISVLDGDSNEIGVILDLAELGAAQRRLAEEELGRRYLTPRIERILACRQRFDTVEWDVETDRGPATLVIRDLREKVKEPLPGHLSVEDVEGNRYDIPDTGALDPTSQRLLDEQI